MDESTRERAERRFDEARAASGARDPRDFYRAALRDLKETNPAGYEEAVQHFQAVLVPSIASGGAEPLAAWREYGRLIAELTGPGRTLAIDETGRAQPYSPGIPMDRLVLHIRDERGARALLVSLPPDPSPAQLATYHLLVKGRQRLPS
ncbi:MAG: hypothetical protein R6T96_10795 [Longimicrobiales bacterium]